MDLHLRDKTALVTGASKGIGAEVATVLAEEGCHVHLAARDRAKLEALADKLRGAHKREVTVHEVDLRTEAGVKALAEKAADVDILVNNAGDIPGGSLEKVNAETWRHAWNLKVFGYIDLTRAIYTRMEARKSGVVVNVIGAAGERFDYDYIAGSTGNAALMAFSRALGSRSLDHGVRVVGLNPGPVQTDRIVTLMKTRAKNVLGDESKWEELMKKMPGGRPATTREIANAVTFLASDCSGYTTGVVVTVDGGGSART